jgi:hypothetical protein
VIFGSLEVDKTIHETNFDKKKCYKLSLAKNTIKVRTHFFVGYIEDVYLNKMRKPIIMQNS